MKFQRVINGAAALLALAILPEVVAGTIAIERTPILTATLTTNTTWQIESSTDGGPWGATGVLVAGTGSSVALRLDGYPANHAYRFSRIGTGTIVVPAVSSGFHLASSFPGAKEVRVESAATWAANAWANRDFVFPDFSGSFVRALQPPFQSLQYFRGLQPAVPLDLASIGSYPADPNTGYSGFGVVADDMPQLYKDGFICAPCPTLYHRGGTNAVSAGECYEFTGPCGTSTAMVGDIGDTAPPGTCDAGWSYFFVGNPAWTQLAATATGSGTATYRLVPAPVVGNVKMVVVYYFGETVFELRPYNYRAGISKLEIRGTVGGATGGNWMNLPRTPANGFDFSGVGAVGFPVNVRVTSRFGEIIGFGNIASMAASQRFTALAQFTMFPEQGPAPVWILPPVYTDSLTNIPGGQWVPTPFSGATVNPVYTGSAYQGSASFQISNFNAFAGVVFTHPTRFNRPLDGAFEFSIRSDTAPAITNLAVVFGGFDSGGASATSSTVTLPFIGTTWRRFRILLEPAQAPARIKEFRVLNTTGTALGTVLLDSIAFRHP